MRFALLNSGLGLLATASELHRLRPDADLVLAMDPDGMPWGPRTPQDIAERSLAVARAAASYEPNVIVMACNTGSVHALDVLRTEFEPDIPVVGTVPAIKPAAAAARSVAIWATVATTASDYQRRLIAEFGVRRRSDAGRVSWSGHRHRRRRRKAMTIAIADAASRTPQGLRRGRTRLHRVRTSRRPHRRGRAWAPCSSAPPQPSQPRPCAGPPWPAATSAPTTDAEPGKLTVLLSCRPAPAAGRPAVPPGPRAGAASRHPRPPASQTTTTPDLTVGPAAGQVRRARADQRGPAAGQIRCERARLRWASDGDDRRTRTNGGQTTGRAHQRPANWRPDDRRTRIRPAGRSAGTDLTASLPWWVGLTEWQWRSSRSALAFGVVDGFPVSPCPSDHFDHRRFAPSRDSPFG